MDNMSKNFDLLNEQHQTYAAQVEARLRMTSDRIKQPSEHDLTAQAAIAAEIIKRQEADSSVDERIRRIEIKTDNQTLMLEKAAGLLKDPKVIFVLLVLYNIVQKWAEKHGYL